MLIDSFPFFNEIGLLRYRLELLKGIVDTTIIVEANTTFSGKPKPLYFKENEHLFKDYKIQHVVVDLPDNGDAWHRERAQRNAITFGVTELGLYPHDHLMISDLDEIPDPTTVKELVNNELAGIVTLEQDLYYYHLECRAKGRWHKAKLMDVGTFSNLGDPETIRHYGAPHVQRGGWHLSYFGDTLFIKNKLEAFSHQEYNTAQFKDHVHIMRCMRECKDLFNRGDGWDHIPIFKNKYLPPNWRNI